jgi:ribose/xylose/arabinose/galactoside ABC-type transport system permease subunit
LTVRQEWQDMILGAIIIAAVTVDQYRQRRLGG